MQCIPITGLFQEYSLRTLVGFQVHYGLTECLAPNFLSSTLRSTTIDSRRADGERKTCQQSYRHTLDFALAVQLAN
jgi:hypothetical protein